MIMVLSVVNGSEKHGVTLYYGVTLARSDTLARRDNLARRHFSTECFLKAFKNTVSNVI